MNELIISFTPYAIFLVSVALMFVLRHKLKFWGEWLIGFGAGALNAVLSLTILDNAVNAAFGLIVPLLFMLVVLFLGRGFDKFVANSMMLILALIPFPWSLVGVLGTTVAVVVYAFIASPSAKASAMSFYYIGTNIAAMLRALRDTKVEEGADNKKMSPFLMLAFVAVPSLLTALAYI